tara:strand:+ start:1125 stop:1409 length:285 start_codon:yes stop_codon:yes gene_type:complete
MAMDCVNMTHAEPLASHLRNKKLDKLLGQRSILIGFSEECVFFFDFGNIITRRGIMASRTFTQRHKNFRNKPAWQIPFDNSSTMGELKDYLTGL